MFGRIGGRTGPVRAAAPDDHASNVAISDKLTTHSEAAIKLPSRCSRRVYAGSNGIRDIA